MKLTDIQKVEDCFDGSQIFSFIFEEEWTVSDIKSLKNLGPLEYFPDFARPFFRVFTKDGIKIKGVEGDRKIKIIFPKEGKEEKRKRIENYFRETQSVTSSNKQ